MSTFNCSACGKTWPTNYCPECARTIDRTQNEVPPRPGIAKPPVQKNNPPVLMTASVPPPLPAGAHGSSAARPTVVTLYRGWCGLCLILYVFMTVYSVRIFIGKEAPRLGLIAHMASEDDPALRAQLLAEEHTNSMIGIGLGLFGTVLFATGLLYCPREPWAWGWGFFAITFSVFPLCCNIVGAIPLLIYWLKPEVKLCFGIRQPFK